MELGRRAAALSQAAGHLGGPQQTETWDQGSGFSGERITIDGSDSDSFRHRALVFLFALAALATLLLVLL